MTTPLAQKITAQIAVQGPITLADYMARCLLDPEHGYYTQREVLGAKGDFTTAPEISQMFGELLGLCLAQAWLDQGAPSPFTLAEAGPGRGTLMADILRATRRIQGFHAAAQITLIEASPKMRARQAATLAGYEVTWAADISALPEQPLFFIANEFFDALPIRQFTRREGLWAETMVTTTPEGNLAYGASPPQEIAALSHRADAPEGTVVEICPAAAPLTTALSQIIAAHGGLSLIIDYGGWRSQGDTFQALSAHRFADPLARPGEADLTAHVDFEALACAAQPLRASYTTQGALLRALGIEARAQHLAAQAPPPKAQAPRLAAERLTAPEQMGQVFKALALFPDTAPLPAGFEAIER